MRKSASFPWSYFGVQVSSDVTVGCMIFDMHFTDVTKGNRNPHLFNLSRDIL